MKKIFTSFIFITLLTFSALCQKVILSGYIYNNTENEITVAANIYDTRHKIGTSTNNFGFFSLSYNKNDTAHIVVSNFGYQGIDTIIIVDSDKEINFLLQQGVSIDRVIVTSNSKSNISSIKIPISEIQIMPSLTGEKDVLRAYQLMPGIQSGSEGTSNLYVRGGSPDQNLILIDDVPVYYINHLGGFVSIFDDNAINNLKVIKGGFPARYGGRLSSVVDIRLKDGNLKKYHGNFSFGVLASKFSIEGPLIKDKISFIASFRRCNLDFITRPLSKFGQMEATSGYTFYDLNFKLRYKVSRKDNLYFSTYSGRDKIFINFLNDNSGFLFPDDENTDIYKIKINNSWGNFLSAVRWNHVYNNKIFSNFTLAYSNFYYNYLLNNQTIENLNSHILSEFNNSYGTSIKDIISKIDFEFYPNRSNKIKIGTYYTYRNYNPGRNFYYLNDSATIYVDTTWEEKTRLSHEYAIYFEDEITFKNRLNLNIGVHSSGYNIESNFYYSIQPRFSLKLNVFNDAFFNCSYTKMQQYVHLITNTQSMIPADLWVPSTSVAIPEKSQQFTLGMSKNKILKHFSIEIEGFYKNLKNLIILKNTSTFSSISKTWEEKIETNGSGKVYGIEFLLQKKHDRLTGWIAYTYSKNIRKFTQINSGFEFPYNYDRRHDLSIVFVYKIKKNIVFSGTWCFGSGYPTTLGSGKYNIINYFEGFNYPTISPDLYFENVIIYDEINNYRMPDYHRLDLALNFTKQKKRGERTWNFSIYNVYNHKNPYFLYFDEDENNQKQLFQFTLFPIIPSVSYSFKF